MPHETPSPLKRVTVALTAPVLWFDKSIAEVVIREPSAAEFFRYGEPVIFAGDASSGSFVEVPDALASYVECCVKVDQPGVFLTLLGMEDGRAIKRAILDFFRVAPKPAPA